MDSIHSIRRRARTRTSSGAGSNPPPDEPFGVLGWDKALKAAPWNVRDKAMLDTEESTFWNH